MYGDTHPAFIPPELQMGGRCIPLKSALEPLVRCWPGSYPRQLLRSDVVRQSGTQGARRGDHRPKFRFLIAGAAGLVSGLTSAYVTYISTRDKIRLELAAEYDKTLQEARLEAYLKLWEILEPLARFGREKPVTHAVLLGVSNQSRTWYFRVGGIYLTQVSRAPYFRWKELMQPLLDSPNYARSPETSIEETELGPVIAAASALRTRLSDDIGTKQLSRV